MSDAYDVAVVGLGAMGAATLYQLAKLGLNVVGIDRHAPPHAHGSSHGETRITRAAVGEGADYVPLVTRSHAIWRELERATGTELFVACGGLVIGAVESDACHRGTTGFLRATIEVARRFGIPHELLDAEALAARFPQFTGLAPGEIAFFEPGAGFLRPEACIAAQLGEAARHGAMLRTGTSVGAIRQTGAGVEIATDAGPVTAARVVVAAGPWTGELLGAPFDRLLRVTRQSLFWFAPEDPESFAADRGAPVFIREHGPAEEDVFYGFPIPAGGEGVKLATERYDDDVDPARYVAGRAQADAATFYETHVRGRLAGLKPAATRSLSCLYTSTVDGRFLIDAHPAMPRVTVISACSGHGFKHSAAIGERVAQRIAAEQALAPFALAGHG